VPGQIDVLCPQRATNFVLEVCEDLSDKPVWFPASTPWRLEGEQLATSRSLSARHEYWRLRGSW
jgi:hypothetical protein